MEKKHLQDEIARVAYSLYEKRGRLDGYQHHDWLEAERIVMARYAKESRREESLAKGVKKKPSPAALKEKDVKPAVKAATSKAKKPAGKS
jgi:hypothetical protein